MGNVIKIAIYSGEIPSTTFIERLIVGISKEGHQVFLFGTRKRKVAYNKNVSVIAFKKEKFHKALFLLKYTILLFLFKNKQKKKLDGIIKSRTKKTKSAKLKSYPVLWFHPDIFHIQWAKSLKEWAWVQEFGIKLVVSFLGTHINYSPITYPEIKTMYESHFPLVDGFHAVSKAIALKGETYKAEKSKIKVVYSGLNAVEPVVSPLEQHKGLLKIVSVGRTHWVKGYTYAINACKELKNRNLKFQYTIIGGKGSEELLYQISDLNLENEIELLGQLSFPDVQKKMRNADLLLLSSVEEGIANVVLEAMQLGTIVLSTDCGGMNEVITHGVNGFLVPVRDSEKMATAIQKINDISQEEKIAIINKAKQTIAHQHTESKMIMNMLALYNQVLCT